MNRLTCFAVLASFCVIGVADQPVFQPMFDGKTLNGWKGKQSLWSVKEGVIVGQTNADSPIKANTFLVWQGGEVSDFEFHCTVRFDASNSGVQYRSTYVNEAALALAGYQADLHPKREYLGMMYSEKTGRGIIATGGQRVEIPAKGKKQVVGNLPPIPPTATDQWNELRIVAVGNRMIHQINGVTTVDVTDNRADAKQSGLLGLQLHKGPPMKAEFKNLKIRKLSELEGATLIGELTTSESAAKPGSKTPTIDDLSQVDSAAEPQIHAPDGFQVERIYTTTNDQGSWVSLATDPQGRLYACDQAKAGLYRITLPSKESSETPLIEKVSVGPLEKVSAAQGLTWAFDSLWCHVNGGNLLRLTDSDGDDVLDTMEKIPGTTGGGEHGNHAVMPTEDGMGLYMVGGNAAPLAKHVASTVPTWYEGLLLPRMWDSRGHARNRKAPGGWITRLDPETHEQTVQSIGYRNEYDIALNRNGDLFTYDADMEWDLGLPWYRPTRICQAVSGSDFGWRSGSAKWPTYYEDSLPPVVEIGPGSPTGLVSGEGTRFPTKYQDALFALDWTFGTIYAIHMVPDGAGYRGEAEPFIYSSPLPLTDAVVGHDGNLYFTVGGRGMASGIFRVRYTGSDSCDEPKEASPNASSANVSDAVQQRRMLETFHAAKNPDAIKTAWPFLSSDDRFLRHAARVAVESQPVESWADRVSSESAPQAKITASVALARMGDASHMPLILQGLLSLDAAKIDDAKLLGMLRGYALTFDRLATPSDQQRTAVIEQLRPLMPSSNNDVTTELIRVLAFLRDETLPKKVMQLIEQRRPPILPAWSELAQRNARYGPAIDRMLDAHPPTREIMYAFMIRNLRNGWTLDLRRSFFEFINEAAKAKGGASYGGYLTRIRDESLATCSDTTRKALEDITGESFDPTPDFPITDPVGPGQQWTVDQAIAASQGEANFTRGRSLYFSGKCASCHRLNGLGGSIGPDLTSVPNKFDDHYLVEAIIHPSKNISDQYGSSQVLTDDGQILVGLVIEKDNGDLTVYPIDENAKAIEVEADSVELIEASKVSQMPAGLLDRLNAEEVRDLIAYIMSGGNPRHKRYVGKKK